MSKKKTNDKRYSKLVKEVAELRAGVESATEIKQSHTDECNNLKKHISELEASLETLQAQLSKAKQDLSHIQGVLVSDDDKIKQTQAKLTATTAQLEDAKRQRNEEVAIWLNNNYSEFDDYSTTDLQNILKEALDARKQQKYMLDEVDDIQSAVTMSEDVNPFVQTAAMSEDVVGVDSEKESKVDDKAVSTVLDSVITGSSSVNGDDDFSDMVRGMVQAETKRFAKK